MRRLFDWLTYWNELIRMTDAPFIRHNVLNMFKNFRRIKLIMTIANAYNRIHANTANELQLACTNESEFCWSPICQLAQVDVGVFSFMCKDTFTVDICFWSQKKMLEKSLNKLSLAADSLKIGLTLKNNILILHQDYYEPRREKTGFFAYAKTKTQNNFAVTAKLISVFVFATWIVQYLYFLNPKFQVSSYIEWLCSPVCVGSGQKPRRPVFWRRGSLYGSNIQNLQKTHLWNKSTDLSLWIRLKTKQQKIWASTWENRSSGFPTRSHTHRAAQLQKMARGSKYRI